MKTARKFGKPNPSKPVKAHKVRGERLRGNSAARGYNWEWRRARAQYLKDFPLCCVCEPAGRITEATVVDHKTPHRGNQVLFWDVANWQALCKPCHDRKTAKGK